MGNSSQEQENSSHLYQYSCKSDLAELAILSLTLTHSLLYDEFPFDVKEIKALVVKRR